MEWEISTVGIKAKVFEKDGKRVRWLELERGLQHPEWCVTGHIGYVVEGELEIDFNGRIVKYSAGDALFISSGDAEKHIPKPISEKVILFMVEEI